MLARSRRTNGSLWQCDSPAGAGAVSVFAGSTAAGVVSVAAGVVSAGFESAAFFSPFFLKMALNLAFKLLSASGAAGEIGWLARGAD